MTEVAPTDFSSLSMIGSRVHLLPLRADHVDDLLKPATISRETYAYTRVPADREDCQQYIDEALRARDKKLAIPFVIVDRQSGAVVGSTRFGNIEYWHWPDQHPMQRPASVPDAAEIGWTWLASTHQRTGINTEAKILLMSYAFEHWKIHRLTFRTDARNERSRRNIERVGGRLDGILRANMPGYDGAVRDTAFYSLLLKEWPAAKQALLARFLS